MEEEEGLLLLRDDKDDDELMQLKRPRLLEEEEEKKQSGAVVESDSEDDTPTGRLVAERLDREEEEEEEEEDKNTRDLRLRIEQAYLDSLPKRDEWIQSLCDIDEDQVKSRVASSTKFPLLFDIAGCVDRSGYAVVLRDYDENPLIARCGVLSDSEKKECASAFYIELKAVATALKMAVRYGPPSYQIATTSFHLANFVKGACRYRNLKLSLGTSFEDANAAAADSKTCLCLCSNYTCKEHTRWLLRPENKNDIEVIYKLTVDMVSDFLTLMSRGLHIDYVSHAVRDNQNRAAQFLAKLGTVQDMLPPDMFKIKELTDILYHSAFFDDVPN